MTPRDDGSGRRTLRRAAPALAAAALAAALLAPGCAAAGLGERFRGVRSEESAQITEEELLELLDRFADEFARTVQEQSRAVRDATTDAAVRREVLVWQIETVRTCRNAVLGSDPQAAFADVWVLCRQQRDLLAGDAFRGRLGELADPVIAAADSLEARVAAIGAQFLSADELERARADVAEFATANPMRPGFARAAPLASAATTPAAARLEWVAAIPMTPFRVFSGIDEGAAAIRHFSAVAERFARRVDSLPQETLWEMQLLLHDVEQQPAVQRSVASVESVARTGDSLAGTGRDLAATAARLQETLHDLPADVRAQVDQALADLDARQAETRKTIDAARGAMAEARDLADRAGAAVRDTKAAAAEFDATAKSVASAAAALESAVRGYGDMMREIHPPRPAGAPAPQGKPFDVLEWQRTADSIAGAASELEKALRTFRETARDDAVSGAAAAAARAARAEADAAVDHAFWRLVQLSLVVAALVVAVRFVRPRRGGPAA